MTALVLLLFVPAQPAPDPVDLALARLRADRAVSAAVVGLKPAGPKRVELHGLWYDRHPDGRLDYCKECNEGRLPAGDAVSYGEAKALTLAGFRIALAVGVPRRDVLFYGRVGYTLADPPGGVRPGHYWCDLVDGVPQWAPLDVAADRTPMRSAPGVAAPRVAFRGPSDGGYDPDHQCDSCGAVQTVVAGFNGDGTHRHQCARCQNVWWH